MTGQPPAGSGALYRGYDQPALDAQYNARATVPDIGPYLNRYAQLSAHARAVLECATDVAYGDHPDETMDIFPAAGTQPADPALFQREAIPARRHHRQALLPGSGERCIDGNVGCTHAGDGPHLRSLPIAPYRHRRADDQLGGEAMSGVFPPTRPPSAATLPARGRDLRGELSRNADAAPSLPLTGRVEPRSGSGWGELTEG